MTENHHQQRPYKTVENAVLKMHVFNPEGHRESDRYPAIVFFFGGGWKGGSPQQFHPHCGYLAGRGMVAIAAEYRVENQHGTTPCECVKDGKSAIRWVRRHARQLGINPHMIAAGGGSAGAHVAVATALAKGFDEEGEEGETSCRPDALVLFNPVLDNGPGGYGYERVKDYWEAFSPIHNIREDTPPTIVFLGTEDKLVPIETAGNYKRTMEENGCRCDLRLYEGQKHGFFNYANAEYYAKTVAEMDAFLESLGFVPAKTDFFSPARDRLGVRIPVATRKDLPNVLLIGDSISIGYTEPVMELLKDLCNVRRAPDNCGDTLRGLGDLDAWLGEKPWDIIHFNWGLHDLCHRHPDATVYGNRDKVNGKLSVPPDDYRRNLETLVRRLENRAARLIWASTTVVPPDEAGRFEGDDLRYNEIAAEIMTRHGIPINDLHALTASFDPGMFTCPGDVHFSEAGTRRIAGQVAACIRKQLARAEKQQ